jgi:transcription elongation factor GreA
MKGTNVRTPTRVWISPLAHERLRRELDTLHFLYSAGIAAGDNDENANAVRRAWERRIQQVHDLLINVVGEDPPEDGIAEPGMVVTIRYDDTGDTDTFLLGVRSAEYTDMEVYSIDSPLAAALTGARPGERRRKLVRPRGGVHGRLDPPSETYALEAISVNEASFTVGRIRCRRR